jgi:hypothetical protein
MSTFDSNIKIHKATKDRVATATYTIRQLVVDKNDKAHDLYVRWALRHILIARKAIRELTNCSNMNALDLADGEAITLCISKYNTWHDSCYR